MNYQLNKKILKIMKNCKTNIRLSQVLVEVFIIITIILGAAYSDDNTKQIINVLAFLIAFIATIYMHKYFFPFILLSVTCFLLAATQELYNDSYTYLPITKTLWSIGNYSLPIGIAHFIYKLIFNFKIIDKDD